MTTTRTRTIWLALIAAILTWLLPEQASATYVDDTYNYSVALNGSNTIRIQVPVYDQKNEDTWIDDGKLKVQWTDDSGTSHSLYALLWQRKYGNTDGDNTSVYIHFKTEVDGELEVTQGNSSSHFSFVKSGNWTERLIYRNYDGHSYTAYIVWRLPYELLGKEGGRKLKFSWDVHRTGTGTRVAEKVSGLNDVEVTVPKAEDVVTPQITQAAIAYSEKGMLEIPWFIASNKVTAARYEYISESGQKVSTNLPAGMSSSTIYLDATVPHRNFQVVASYVNNVGYQISNVTSAIQNLKMIHAPVNFKVTPLGDNKATVRLTWNTIYPETEDIALADFFEIQRSITGEEADFETIGTLAYQPEEQSYTYDDATLANAITAAHLKGGSILPKLTYRVRRMISQNWGWTDQPCATSDSCIINDIHLLRVSTWNAKWEDKQANTIRVNWEYAKEPNAVWDNRAEIKLRVTSTNRQGETVETKTYTISSQEREQCYKVISLERPCVDYKIEVFVESGTSPLPNWDGSDFIAIYTEDDWNRFAAEVNLANGTRDVNARLYADITVRSYVGQVANRPFRGYFDGNGHTITVNFNNNIEGTALFRYAKDYTIANLHLAGEISSSKSYTAGLVGYSLGSSDRRNVIRNCRVSATISCGDYIMSGFIGHAKSSNHNITNCLFDGKLDSNHSNDVAGVFIGWSDSGGINYCANNMECGTYEKVDKLGLFVINKGNSAILYSNDDANYINNWSANGLSDKIVINTTDNFNVFARTVSKGEYNKIDAILNADIDIYIPVGETNAFCGTFNGSGHTLNVWFKDFYKSFLAPFLLVNGATFSNLNVTGYVENHSYPGGLIGQITKGSVNQISNTRVSTTVATNNTIIPYAAGFVGYADGATVNISNCLYDGQLTSSYKGANVYAFIHGPLGQWSLTNCYENAIANQNDINSYALLYNYTRHTYTSCYAASSFVTDLPASNRSITNQSTAVSLLGDQWELKDGRAVPKMDDKVLLHTLGTSWTEVDGKVVPLFVTFSQPTDIPTFYYESTGKIDKKLMTQTRQSSVLLTWETDGNPIDYFTVMRRTKATATSPEGPWEEIATNIDHLSYEDKDVSPLENYQYKVRATNDCEGVSYSETDVTDGACKHTGMLEGYVRLKDGTGVADIQVEIVPDGGTGPATIVVTDDKGYFMADELSYHGQPSISYNVTPVSGRPISLDVSSYGVTFNNRSNHEVVHEFTITNSHRFTGSVMYEGTSIPVKGVRFLVNGREIHNAQEKPVETDFEGNFEFNVLSGNNIIQAFMDGHSFTNNGYFKSPNGYVFTDDVAMIYFYDDTKVKLTGRVVGGKDQGSLPLDNNLSRNNLGQDLTMVLTLEGDNTSWLVYDNVNPTLTTRKLEYKHPGGNGHKTVVEMQRKRMVVKPDSVTGEYMLKLPPVRWKVQQVYCEGYPTLFQDGQVSEVVDLTECLTPIDTTFAGTFRDVDGQSIYQPSQSSHAIYNRIYHTPVEITYRQVGYDTFDYFGDKNYYVQTIGGSNVEVPLVSENATEGGVRYTFGYPVFSLERKYPIEITVAEHYPWNGVAGTQKTDLVKVGGGKVTVHNGLKNGVDQQTVELDEDGKGVFYLEAGQAARLLTEKDALRTVTMTLEQDGTSYEAAPLQGYVLNMFATGGSKDVLVSGEPMLIDILRDPPGGSSTATLSKGSKLKFSYTVDMKFRAGMDLSFGMGTSLDNYSGVVAGMFEYGLVNSGSSTSLIDLNIIFSGSGKKGYSYTMNVNEDITTSSGGTMVGADADLYMGVVQNMIVTPVSTIRAIPDSMYKHMLGRLGNATLPTGNNIKYGTLVHIKEGTDAQGNVYHLIRDESLGYGPQVESQFVHSQKHIISELLPKLANEIRAMIYTGTRQEAKTQANATGKPVYLSLVAPTDADFGVKYEMIKPDNAPNQADELAGKYRNFMAWVEMIGENEYEKLSAHDLVANYDVDGGSKVTYSENFETEYSVAQNINYPFTTADYFGTDGTNDTDRLAAAGAVLLSQPAVGAVLKMLSKALSFGGVATGDVKQGEFGRNSIELKFAGASFNFGIKPVVEYNATGTYGTQHNYTRKESFNLSMDPKSHLNVDVYRVKTLTNDKTDDEDLNNLEVFHNGTFDDWMSIVNNHVKEGVDYNQAIYPHSFIYRTRGGATCNTWEDERRTVVYRPGTLLDERTKKISNPRITLDRQSVSGVAVGDPARFKMYITNDSEQPEAATGSLTMFTLFPDGGSNPNGAKFFMDGNPLNGNGVSVVLYPGKVLEKTLEVYAGNEYDYEGLAIGIASSSDFANTQNLVNFDVHFLRTAGPVNISNPSDKWVMNTNAQWNEKRGWFLPITIDGFNKYQHNFDHIEFQYKESLRGEDSWTNLCSYYADSTLMVQASGTREMIPENGNIQAQFFGEGTVMEKAYDLRAVLYCRNGNTFLTSASKVMSGVKDTRRPQLFGTPEPTDGVVTAGQSIVFNFSEDIEYNYLNKKTNFEVKGEVNNDNVSESVSLLFSGKASVESEAQRNFNGKDLTIDLMVKPDNTGRDMPLFSHGTNSKKLQLWLTADSKLKAVVNDQTFTSEKSISTTGFTQVAMSINLSDSLLTFFNGGEQIGQAKLSEFYDGTGPLIFGRTNEVNRNNSQYYEGRMMEARLWYRALTGGQVGTTYGNRRLTGYELGLVGYYPMNEGTGNYAIDHTQGANATLHNASWAIPRGLSLHLEWEDRGLELNQDVLNRSSEQDYTLMFWFKTDDEGRGVLIANGAGRKTETNAGNQFCLAFEGEKLMYRSNGFAAEVPGRWSDNKWHHYAMTVSRTRGLVNIYMDQTLVTTFASDSLGGLKGGIPLIGAARYNELQADGHVATIDTRNWLRGNLDELCVFAQALPISLIKSYAMKSPGGTEAGLLTYLSFDRQERQSDNDLVLVAYPYSKKAYTDDMGNIRYQLDPVTKEPTTTPVRDFPFASDVTVEQVISHIDGTLAAPVVPYEELKNLNFSFVGKGNQVLVNIDEQMSRVNHRNVYVTVRDIEDKNGNAMASPATVVYYITSSTLQWVDNHQITKVMYGEGEEIYLGIMNNGAKTRTFTVENCPKWLSLNTYTDVIGPQGFASITAKVNKNLNVGSYDEIIYLTDDEGITEPLYLNLTVEAMEPDWTWSIPGELLQYSMNVSGQVFINGEIDVDARDIVGVFDRENVCHGFAHIDYSALTGESGLFLTINDNKSSGRELFFKLWQYSTGRELLLTPSVAIKFESSTVLGTDTPVRFTGGSEYVQTFDLKRGWNWLSFNVASEKLFNLNNLLDGLPWREGDILTDMNSDVTLYYRNGHWLASGDLKSTRISPKKAYAIKVQEDIKFPVAGTIIKQQDARTIELKQGWNAIGYTPMLNLPVETALSDYYDKAQAGDVVKSHDEFAYFTITGGVGRWRGSLQYMKPGEGYMFLRKDATETKFLYPFYEPNSAFIDEWAYATSRAATPNRRSTMSLSAVAEGIELEEGDRLVAYANGEQVGEAPLTITDDSAASRLFYLSIGGDEQTGVWFAVEREGEMIAATRELLTFNANAVVGSPDEPTVINFAQENEAAQGWYTTSGIKLPRKPGNKGVYIFNGKKVVIK